MIWKTKTTVAKGAKGICRTSERGFTVKLLRAAFSAREIVILSQLRIAKLSLLQVRSCRLAKRLASEFGHVVVIRVRDCLFPDVTVGARSVVIPSDASAGLRCADEDSRQRDFDLEKTQGSSGGIK
jgi:hypothetical protein